MIDGRRVEEAARLDDKEYYDRLSDNDRCFFEYGFRRGYNRALKNLWHPASEEPVGYDEWILLHYNVGNYYSLAQVKEFKSWKGFVERAPIEEWLYIEDLLAKEGGEQ